MATGDRDSRPRLNRIFSEDQTLTILNEIGVTVLDDTSEDWICLCPFHGNLNTPAFSVHKTEGIFFCFNETCGVRGDILTLVKSVTRKSIFASERIIARARANSPASVVKTLQKNMEDVPMPVFSQGLLDKLKGAFWKTEAAMEYMRGRGFTDETLMHYDIGFSPKAKLITVPMADAMANPVGFVGRSITSKRFRNSDDLPKSRTLWNMHRAKRNAKVVVTEASFDAMRVWQATGIEAVACLGSSLSQEHIIQLNKYFTHVVVMTDDDQKLTYKPNCRVCKQAGRSDCSGHNTGLRLGLDIAAACKGPVVTWAHLDSLKRYDGMKDAGDMTDEQIKYSIDNAITNFEMQRIVSSVV